MARAIALLSGGLDSILATKLILEQGIDVEALNFVTVFCACTAKDKTCLSGKSAADNLGIKLKVLEISKESFEIIKNPKHGYGKNMNPCIDCRILIFKKAGEYMRETGASFLITGEVLGQRPMSQRKDAMRIIDRDSGMEGLIVRPLSARFFEPTIPEKEGLIDREKFLSMKGRSRKPQIQLAKDLGINDYPGPAGGCLLTDPGFANRMRDLIKYNPNFSTNDVQILKTGRCFRLGPKAKLVVGRNETENERLLHLARESDTCFYPGDVKGPIGLGRGAFREAEISKAARIIARYSDNEKDNPMQVSHGPKNTTKRKTTEALPLDEPQLTQLRI